MSISGGEILNDTLTNYMDTLRIALFLGFPLKVKWIYVQYIVKIRLASMAKRIFIMIVNR